MIFEVLPIELRTHSLVEVVKNLLVDVFEASVVVLPYVHAPQEFENVYRRQYDGLKLLNWSSRLRTTSTSILVGVADLDAYVPGLNFIFGIADPKEGVALVFLKRLRDSNELVGTKYVSRIKKEVLHEVGHVLGLRHCSNRRCVMAFSNSIYDTDFKEFKYCYKCYDLLIRLGYRVRRTYMLEQ
ncbi:MAG: archaemetzincin family Zn-dependent metalloprotease [Sulfolobales archaeon]